jgi:hypothetical protein
MFLVCRTRASTVNDHFNAIHNFMYEYKVIYLGGTEIRLLSLLLYVGAAGTV